MRTSFLALETSAGTSVIGNPARHVVWPRAVTLTVNLGICLDYMWTRLRRVRWCGRPFFVILPSCCWATSSLPITLWCRCSAISYASRSLLEYASMDVAYLCDAQYRCFLFSLWRPNHCVQSLTVLITVVSPSYSFPAACTWLLYSS